MDWLEALLLGIIQGLTEFLPVSSSGHLELGKAMMKGMPGEEDAGMLFTVVVHAATALSTVVVFRYDIWEILKGLFSFKWNEETKFAAKIVLSMIPAAIVGLAFNDQLEELFKGKVLFVGFMLLLTGLLLFLANKAKYTNKPVSFSNAAIIGIAQAIAILPGISRSGATISTSVLLGVDRDRAARFSFLMVVPLILGKMAKDLLDGWQAHEETGKPMFDGNGLELAVGFVAAFITGLIACRVMITIVRRAQLKYFSYYCFVVGTIAIIVGYMNGLY